VILQSRIDVRNEIRIAISIIFYAQLCSTRKKSCIVFEAVDDFLSICIISERVRPTLTGLVGMKQRMGKWKYRSRIKYARRTALFQIKRNFRAKVSVDNNKIPIGLSQIYCIFLKHINLFIIATSKNKLRCIKADTNNKSYLKFKSHF